MCHEPWVWWPRVHGRLWTVFFLWVCVVLVSLFSMFVCIGVCVCVCVSGRPVYRHHQAWWVCPRQQAGHNRWWHTPAADQPRLGELLRRVAELPMDAGSLQDFPSVSQQVSWKGESIIIVGFLTASVISPRGLQRQEGSEHVVWKHKGSRDTEHGHWGTHMGNTHGDWLSCYYLLHCKYTHCLHPRVLCLGPTFPIPWQNAR